MGSLLEKKGLTTVGPKDSTSCILTLISFLSVFSSPIRTENRSRTPTLVAIREGRRQDHNFVHPTIRVTRVQTYVWTAFESSS